MKAAKEQIMGLDYILTGTITRKYGTCGKKNCRCVSDKKYWHGPYYIWTRKEEGKTVTKILSPTQERFCKKAISNAKKLKAYIEKWKLVSLKAMLR